ncbi:MAG TPA: Arm DNA-binding domain-containing protein, partial [Chitinophagaceae bacterium]|nr:Arm DNA-binding domain-containing protein [Chitinophagaceae bacterium]
MENNIKVLFFIHKAKLNRKGKAPLKLRVTLNSKRKDIATGYYLRLESWDFIKGRVKGKSPETVIENKYMAATRLKLMGIFREVDMDGDISLETIIAKFLGKNNNLVTLIQAVRHHNEYFKARIGTMYSKSTFRTYLLTENRLKSFLRDQYGKTDIRLKDLKKHYQPRAVRIYYPACIQSPIHILHDSNFLIRHFAGQSNRRASKLLPS